jgi:CheY-like chemotaxis protein
VRSLQVWIVDDSTPDVYLIQLALSKTGVPMEIQSFSDGEKAVEAVDACRNQSSTPPDIVLLDMHLPKIEGIDVLRAIRAAPNLSNVRVAIFGQKRERDAGPKADCYLRKPGDLDEFVAEISTALSRLRPET